MAAGRPLQLPPNNPVFSLKFGLTPSDILSISLGGMVAAGTPVARILSVDTVTIVGGVPERYAAEIERGSEVTVEIHGDTELPANSVATIRAGGPELARAAEIIGYDEHGLPT